MSKRAVATIPALSSEPVRRRLNATSLWLGLGLLVLTAAVYAPVRHYAFLNYDDEDYVTGNAHVSAGLSRDGIVWAWTGVHQATWHPLTTLSHMLDCQLFGLNAGPHHLGNLVLHVLNTLLLFAMLARMTAQPWRSAWVAALFALHPLHVESVAWISERKDVLSTCFWLLTVWAYLAYVRRPGWRAYALVLVAYIAALLSKPMVVTLPFILLLLDVWPLGRLFEGSFNKGFKGSRVQGFKGSPQKTLNPGTLEPLNPRTLEPLLREKLPLLLLAGILSVITYMAQTGAGAVASLAAAPLAVRTANAMVAYASYLVMTVWPTGLAVFYPFAAPLPTEEIVAATAFLILTSAAVLWGARRYPYLLTGWLWYLGMLVPVIGLVHQGDQAMADRFTYLPLVGIFIMAAWGIPELLGHWRHGRMICSVAAVVTLLACTALTVRQLQYWRDSLSLFEHAVAVTRNNYVAHFIIGSALQEQGRHDEAFPHLAESLRIQPNYDKPNYDIGLIFAARGDLDAAKQHYLHALRLNPSYAKVHVGLARVLAAQGDKEGALAHYRDAIRIDPDMAAAHNDLAITLEDMGQLDEAIQQYADGVRLEPKRAESRCNLAAALISAGRLSEAIEQFRTALRLKPELLEARFGLATAYIQTGNTHDAIVELDDVLRQRPEWTAPATTLAWLLATAPDAHLRDGARALQLAEAAAARTEHRDPDVLNTLAAAYAEVGRFPDAVETAKQALSIAQAGGRTALADALTDRLARYRAGEPVREQARRSPA